MGSQFFYLRKNSLSSGSKNNRFNIINTSVPYMTYKTGQDGLEKQNGYNYRPAIRMQFVPVMQNEDDKVQTKPWVYPSKIKIMKQADYKDNLFDENAIQFSYYSRTNNGSVYSDWQLDSNVNKQSVFANVKCTASDSRKDNAMYGIAFNQYVAYSELNIQFSYSVQSNGVVTQNINVYASDASAILYKGQRTITSNWQNEIFEYDSNDDSTLDYVKTNLHYVCPKSGNSSFFNNDVYATLLINKSFYEQNGVIYNYQVGQDNVKSNISFVGNQKQFLVKLKFKNNFLIKRNENTANIKITNLSGLNGVYQINGAIKNGKNVYYNAETKYFVYSLIDSTNKSYWVISDVVVIEDVLTKTVAQLDQIVFYSQSLITTQQYKWKYQINSPYSYSDVQFEQPFDVPVVQYDISDTENALQLNYQRQNNGEDIVGFLNLFKKSNNNLYYWRQQPLNNGYRWIDNSKIQQDAIFTRTLGTNLSTLTNNAIKGVQYSVTSQTDSFKINRPGSDQSQNNFTLYFDYAKKTETGEYLAKGINQFFNQPIILSFQFSTWGQSGTDLQHDISTHYQYAFAHVDDYYKSSKKDLCLLYQQQSVPFLLNDKKNQKNIDSSLTYLNGVGFPNYINYNNQYFANVKQQEDTSYSYQNGYRRIVKYRYSRTQFNKNDSDISIPWHQINQPTKSNIYNNVTSIENANVHIQFANASENVKQVFLQVADEQFNVSEVVYGTMTVWTTKPSSTFIKITGTNGGTNYTGVYIDDATQQFTVDNKVMVQFAAYSQIGLSYKITGDVYKQYLYKKEDGTLSLGRFDEYKPFDANKNIVTLQLIPQIKYTAKNFSTNQNNALKTKDEKGNVNRSEIQSCLPQGILNSNAEKQITVTFRDQAGNTQSITGKIVLNTRLFETKNRNLRQATSTYDLQLYKTSNNINTLIARTDTKKSSTKRNWRDVFYPQSHGYPQLANGDIDVAQALKITQATDNFDPVVRSNNQIVYDEQGRTTTVWSNRKKYPTMVSSYGDISNRYSGFVYWVIDNKGFGDITLQFEHFYLDTIAYGPPYNQNLGQRPDSLVVYDASQQGCVQQSVNQVGETTYTLIDTTKLKQLQVYTGSGANVMSLLTGTVNATAQGQFTTQAFATQRICLIFYSDYRNSTDSATSPIGSGFKLKAAKQIVQYWQNFDIDSTNGLVWVHASSDNDSQASGLSVDNVKMTYDYYSTKLHIDYDQGSVIFDQQPQDTEGNPTDVFATYTYYTYDAKDRFPCRTFLLDADDLVDYADVNLYYLPSGVTPIKTGTVSPIYKDTGVDGVGQYAKYNAGKLNNYFFVDKDRGIIQFNNGVSMSGDEYGLVPRGRMFADYRYHTYQRLGNDGYSDFEFNDSMLIAGITTQYPDYTWGDIKIVNQGDAQLRDGKLIFLARGQVENNVITSVLDYDRPWDVQEGTAQQTYDKVAVVIRKNYAWNSYTCTRDQAKNLYKTSGVNTFPDVIKPKEIFYGRIVYCLGGANDSYPTTTAGRKTFSSEISGRFIQVD